MSDAAARAREIVAKRIRRHLRGDPRVLADWANTDADAILSDLKAAGLINLPAFDTISWTQGDGSTGLTPEDGQSLAGIPVREVPGLQGAFMIGADGRVIAFKVGKDTADLMGAADTEGKG